MNLANHLWPHARSSTTIEMVDRKAGSSVRGALIANSIGQFPTRIAERAKNSTPSVRARKSGSSPAGTGGTRARSAVSAVRLRSLAQEIRHPSPGAVGPGSRGRPRRYADPPTAALLTGLGAGERSPRHAAPAHTPLFSVDRRGRRQVPQSPSDDFVHELFCAR